MTLFVFVLIIGGALIVLLAVRVLCSIQHAVKLLREASEKWQQVIPVYGLTTRAMMSCEQWRWPLTIWVSAFRAHCMMLIAHHEQLAAASEETSVVTVNTSESMRKQQSEISQVATAMNEMHATASEVARSASLAAEAAHHADGEAVVGRDVSLQTIDAIESLSISG